MNIGTTHPAIQHHIPNNLCFYSSLFGLQIIVEVVVCVVHCVMSGHCVTDVGQPALSVLFQYQIYMSCS